MGIAAQCVHGAGLCVLPRPENDYRPLALRHGPLAFVSALLVATKVLALLAVAVTPATAELSTITAARVVQLTNAERAQAGLSTLTVSPALTAAAEQKGAHMLKEDYFAHISPSGVTPWFWIKQAGYTYQVAGENLAIDFTEAEDVVAAWIASPSHRDNMLHSAYTETGVAAVTGEFQGGTSIVVVHMFGLPTGAPKPEAIQGETDTPPSSPEAEPTPEPAPPPPPADTTPPRTPRIAVPAPREAVGATLTVLISGEAGSLVTVFANDAPVASLTLTSAEAEHTLELARVPDGPVTLTARAEDAAGNVSGTSEALRLAKDTQAPEISRQAVTFIVNPLTDAAQAALRAAVTEASVLVTHPDGTTETIAPDQPTLISITTQALGIQAADPAGNVSAPETIALLPQFAYEAQPAFIQPPALLSQAARRVALGFAGAVAVLLLLTILIQVRVQRPALITHASAVMGLAALLFFF